VISTTQFVPNSNYVSVKQQTLCQIKPLEIQIAQHHFNSKTVFKNKVTKHSDYFVWKDTSERMARRCDDTVDRKRVNSCVLKHLSLEGVEQPKKWPTNPGNTLSDALLMSRFQNFAADATKENSAPRRFLQLRFARFWIMNGFEIIRGQRFWDVISFTEAGPRHTWLGTHFCLRGKVGSTWKIKIPMIW